LVFNYRNQRTAEGSVFEAASLCFLFVRICAEFTWKTCLVSDRLDEFEGQGQRSKVKVTWNNKTLFFGSLRVVYVW